jgi:hypothetical protein
MHSMTFLAISALLISLLLYYLLLIKLNRVCTDFKLLKFPLNFNIVFKEEREKFVSSQTFKKLFVFKQKRKRRRKQSQEREKNFLLSLTAKRKINAKFLNDIQFRSF